MVDEVDRGHDKLSHRAACQYQPRFSALLMSRLHDEAVASDSAAQGTEGTSARWQLYLISYSHQLRSALREQFQGT